MIIILHPVPCLCVPQAHCPIYLVNVSSMAAGDVVATAKMQGNVNFLLLSILSSNKIETVQATITTSPSYINDHS